MKYKVLIADDEPLARERLRTFVAGEPDLDLVGEAGTGHETLGLVRTRQPDLAFLDVQMPAVDGLAVAQQLAGDRRPLVVFTTAHAHYAAEAYAANVVDYLLKPFSRARFHGALAKVRELLAGRVVEPRKERLLVKSQGRYVVVKIGEIHWLEAAGNYVVLHLGGANHVLRSTLAEVLRQLGGERFFRIGRAHAVNLNHVSEVRMEDPDQHDLILPGGARLRLQRSFRELQQRLEAVHGRRDSEP